MGSLVWSEVSGHPSAKRNGELPQELPTYRLRLRILVNSAHLDRRLGQLEVNLLKQ